MSTPPPGLPTLCQIVQPGVAPCPLAVAPLPPRVAPCPLAVAPRCWLLPPAGAPTISSRRSLPDVRLNAPASLLLSYGADPHAKAKDGTTPFSLSTEIAQLTNRDQYHLFPKEYGKGCFPCRWLAHRWKRSSQAMPEGDGPHRANCSAETPKLVAPSRVDTGRAFALQLTWVTAAMSSESVSRDESCHNNL